MISIVTPTFNALPALRRCCASVRDQAGVAAEHLVMDGASTDGTADWLRSQPRLRWRSEPDRGMYDAINKGLQLAQGDVWGYLNSDEQYLPGTLAAVAAAFEQQPDTDIVCGDALLVWPDGTLAAFRKAYPLRWPYVASSHLYVLSCTLFFRRSFTQQVGLFDPSCRAAGDAEFVLRALRSGARRRRLRRYLSVFTMHDTNLGATPEALDEWRRLMRQAPAWVRRLRPILNACRLAEKTLSGCYRQSWPLDYAVYAGDGETRTRFSAQSGTFRWPS